MAKVCPGSTNHRMGNHGMELAEWGFLSAIAFVWSSGFCGREGRVNAAVWGIER